MLAFLFHFALESKMLESKMSQLATTEPLISTAAKAYIDYEIHQVKEDLGKQLKKDIEITMLDKADGKSNFMNGYIFGLCSSLLFLAYFMRK